MSTISGLSASALYAKAKAVYASHLTQGTFAELAAMTDFAEFVGYIRTKTPYAEAFEAIGGNTGKLSRRQFEGIIKRMTLMRLEKILRYASLCDDGITDYFRMKHECECIIRRLRQQGDYELDSYFMYIPDGFFKKTCFELYALERACTPKEILAVLKNTPYENVLARLISGTPEAENARLVPENRLYSFLYEHSAAVFKKKAPGDFAEIETLLATLGDMLAVSTLYRIKTYYPENEEVLRLHVYRSPLTRFAAKERTALEHASGTEEFVKTLGGTCYKGLVPLLKSGKAAIFTKQYLYDVCRERFSMTNSAALAALCFSACISAEADNLILLAEGICMGAKPEDMTALLVC